MIMVTLVIMVIMVTIVIMDYMAMILVILVVIMVTVMIKVNRLCYHNDHHIVNADAYEPQDHFF